MSRSVEVMWILLPVGVYYREVSIPAFFVFSWSFLILRVGSGFSRNFGEFAIIFRILNFDFDFRSFLALFSFDFPS